MLEKVDVTSWTETQRFLQQTLNEVLNGFEIDCEMQLHAPQERVGALADKLDVISDERMLTAEDALLLVRASYFCEEEFENDEFSTRMGFTMAEGRQIAARIKKVAAGSMPKNMHAAAS